MKVKFSDICTITSSKRIFESEYVERGIPFIRGQEISDGSILDENAFFECYISQERYNEIRSKYYVPKLGDILITAVGTIGNLCYIDRNRDFYFKDGNVILFTSFNEGVYSKYLFYYMKSPIFKKQLEYTMIGAVQKALTMVMLNKIEIDLPNIETQKSIVEILDKIDSKILINNRINSELESMTKTIYDYWFTQFDFPDENGKPYRSSGGAMVWNEQLKRDIPQKWALGSVSDCVAKISTGLNPRDNFVFGNGNIRYITVKNLTTSGDLDFSGCDMIDEEARALVHRRSDICIGDILFASIAPLGRCFLIQQEPADWDINESVFSIRSKTSTITPEYLYLFFQSDSFIQKATYTSTGSIFKGIRINTLLDTTMIIPELQVCKRFSNAIKPLLAEINNNSAETARLTSLRDWLLPMLMNGQVAFKNKQEEKPQIQVSGFEQWLATQGYAARGDVDMDVLRDIYEAMDSDDK